MAQFIKELTLDIDKDLLQTIDAIQNDVSSRFILFDLFCNSLPLNLTGNSVQIYARKPDYSFIFNNVTIEDYTNGKVQVELTSQALAVAGTLNCELIITGSDNSILSTKPFNINVIESLKNDNAVESTNEFTALTTAVSTVTSYDSRITANTNHIGDLAGAGLSETDLAIAIKNDRTNMTNYVLKSDRAGEMCNMLCNVPPTGWLERNGQILSRTTYPNLWTFAQNSGYLISDSQWTGGTNDDKLKFSSGDGSTTFRIMDTRGVHIRDWDHGRGLDSGRSQGTYQADQIKSHAHTLYTQDAGVAGSATDYRPLAQSGQSKAPGTVDVTLTGGNENTVKNASYMGLIHW